MLVPIPLDTTVALVIPVLVPGAVLFTIIPSSWAFAIGQWKEATKIHLGSTYPLSSSSGCSSGKITSWSASISPALIWNVF